MNKGKLKSYAVVAGITLVTIAVLNRLKDTNPVKKAVSGS